LGLTIAKEFIKLHGGKIEINPETDKGAEFIITIPKNYEK
jgi:signal transduction histidine kinase